MQNLFYDRAYFNQDLSEWNTKSVIRMDDMLERAAFSGDPELVVGGSRSRRFEHVQRRVCLQRKHFKLELTERDADDGHV